MDVKCSRCNKVYEIVPNGLSPKLGKLVFPCLECSGPVMVELHVDAGDRDNQLKRNTSGKTQQKTSDFPKLREKKYKSGEALKEEIIQTLDKLPPMPQVISQALETLADPESGLNELSRIIETDQSVVSNILKIVNSAYYGLSGKVSSVRKACVLLGKKTLREIIIMAQVSVLMETSLRGYGFASGELWLHSIASAIGSKLLVEDKKPDLANDAYIAGLIHDVGKIILDHYVYERKAEFENVIQSGKYLYFQAEKKILGFDHAEIASEICAKWNFPKNIALAIQYHHYPSRSRRDELSYIVHMGGFIARLCGFGYGRDDTMHQMEEGVTDFLSFKEENLSLTMSKLIECMQEFIVLEK